MRKMNPFLNPPTSPTGPPKRTENPHKIHTSIKEIPGDDPRIDTNGNLKFLVLTNKTNIIHLKSREESLNFITFKSPVTRKQKRLQNRYYNPFNNPKPDYHITGASNQSIYPTVEPKLKKCSNSKLPFMQTHHHLEYLSMQDAKDVAIIIITIIRKLMRIKDVSSLKIRGIIL